MKIPPFYRDMRWIAFLVCILICLVLGAIVRAFGAGPEIMYWAAGIGVFIGGVLFALLHFALGWGKM